MNVISTFILKQIDSIFLLFVGITLYGAIRSTNLNLENISSRVFLLVILLFLGIYIITRFKKGKKILTRLIKRVTNLLQKNALFITTAIFLMILLFQMIVLINISTGIGWDVGYVINTIRDSGDLSYYLSVNPNNQFYFFIMYGYARFIDLFVSTASTYWFSYQFLNIIIMDLSAILIFKVGKIAFNSKIAYLSLYLYMFLYLLSPWILVPYSDNLALFITILSFYLYLKIDVNKKRTLFLSLTLGLLVGILYLLKPSAIIFLIAWFLITLLKKGMLKAKINRKKIVASLIFVSFFIVTMVGFNQFMEHQKIVQIDQNAAKPWSLFVLMGMKGKGGYDAEETKINASIADPEARHDYNISKIKEVLKGYKLSGYTKFLVEKQFYNSDRGDFGWGVDGTPQKNPPGKSNKFQDVLRELYYQNGKKSGNMRFYMQIIWLIILIGMAMTFKKQSDDPLVLILKLSVIGAFMYLLLFEGGRSRYLIQYLPIFILLSSVGLSNFKGIKDLNREDN